MSMVGVGNSLKTTINELTSKPQYELRYPHWMVSELLKVVKNNKVGEKTKKKKT